MRAIRWISCLLLAGCSSAVNGHSVPVGASHATFAASQTIAAIRTPGPSTASGQSQPAPGHASTINEKMTGTAKSPSVPESAPANTAATAPPAHGQFDYQIGGPYVPRPSVQIVDRDRTESPVPGKYNICYVNALQTQPDEDGQSSSSPPYGTTQWWLKNHGDLLVRDHSGAIVLDPQWNEAIIDVSTALKRRAVFAIEQPWIDGCKKSGFNAIEPDNLDSYDRSGGAFAFDADSAYMRLVVPYAHSKGLAVAQKNANSEFGSTGKSVYGFDFAITEDCAHYSECEDYTNVYGANVIEIEYTDSPLADFTKSCTARGRTISIIRRDRNVVPLGAAAYSYALCP